ncbi:MAG: glycosyltransferase family 10 domain-containing protein [Halarcobacter sp.]
MNKKISFVQNYNLNNKIFDINDQTINRDNFGFFYYKLRETFLNNGLDLSTSDLNKPEESDIIFFNGLTQKIVHYKTHKSYLLALESPHVDVSFNKKENHKYFNKIFTWDDRLIDNIKYFKVNYSFNIPNSIPKLYEGKKLCTTIAGNKTANHKDELYTKRIELIRWFEDNHIDDFDLFGMGWEQRDFGSNLLGKFLNKISPLKKIFYKPFPSYKGTVSSKFETLVNYKFAICYENIKDQPGYITEKIFDTFFAGCIPIYWGANNISDHIPANCFIDKRNFKSFEELYAFINSMEEDSYFEYLDNIEKFLNSNQANPFRAEFFADTIVKEILKDFNDIS